MSGKSPAINIKRGRGRPHDSNSDRRDALLQAARQLFLSKPYNRVSIREVASEAGVDSGLINYYFGRKEKLYQAMISEIYTESMNRLKEMKQESPPCSIQELFDLIYGVYNEHPDLAVILLRTLILNEGPSRAFLLRDIVTQLREFVISIFDKLQHQGVIDSALDTGMLEDAFAGLCLRPFQMRHIWINQKGPEETQDYILKLMQQNADLFERAVKPKSSGFP